VVGREQEVEPLLMGFGLDVRLTSCLRPSPPRPEPSSKGFFIGRTKSQCVSKKATVGVEAAG